MESRCDYCDFFGEKRHCNNCKIAGTAREHTPQELKCSLAELISMINDNDNIEDTLGVGDYIRIKLLSGEEVTAYILGFNHDDVWNENAVAKVTFGIKEHNGLYTVDAKDNSFASLRNSNAYKTVQRFINLLPKKLRDNIVPVKKYTGDTNGEIVESRELTFLFSEVEVVGDGAKMSWRGEGSQYEYFQDKASHMLQYNGFLRSPCRGYSARGILIDTYGTTCACSYGSYFYLLPFGFCIGKRDNESEE